MTDQPLRLVGVLAGDIHHDPAAKIKYGLFFESIARHFELVDVHDVSLKGMARVWNAIQVFHVNLSKWRKRYWKNIEAYRSRSQKASSYVLDMNGKVDAVLQIGVLFDANWRSLSVPSFIYTDYTAHLSALRPEAGRSPFTAAQLQEWIDLEKHAYQQAAHIFTRAEFVRDSIISAYGISPQRVSVVGGGINFERMPEAVSRSVNEDPVVLFIGRDFHRKGGDLMLNAFAQTRKGFPSAKLLFMTRDQIPDGFSLDGVELLPSAWNRDKVIEYFLRANVFVLPSRLETWGDVVLEAMSYSLACIGINESPMTEILQDGETGLLVNAEDVHALSDGLVKLFEDAPLRLRLANAGRQRVEAFYTWDHVVQRMVSMFQENVKRGD